MPKDIFDSLNLWELSKCEDCIILGDNTIKLPRGVAEGVFTKLLGITISIDYLVIECAGVIAWITRSLGDPKRKV